MNEFDFSQLSAVATPESWIENALNIPKKKKPLPFLLRPYVIGAAASLVIVAAVLFTVAVHQVGDKPFKQPEDVFVASPVQETTEGEAYPTELVPVTDAGGEVVGTVAVPVARQDQDGTEASSPSASSAPSGTAPSSTAPAAAGTVPPTQSATQSATQSDSQPVTESVTQPATQAPIAPATETLTQSQEDVNVEVETGGQGWSGDGTTAPQTAAEKFTGSFTLTICPENPLFNSTYVRLDFSDQNGSPFDVTLILKPKLNNAGCKSVTFYPSSNGITLYRWQTFALRVYDTNGNSSAVSVTPTFPGGITVRI